jgi:hypothetical protein
MVLSFQLCGKATTAGLNWRRTFSTWSYRLSWTKVIRGIIVSTENTEGRDALKLYNAEENRKRNLLKGQPTTKSSTIDAGGGPSLC